MSGRKDGSAGRGRRWASALVIGLVVLAALAPRSVRADAAEEARFHDELARRHYAARRYEQAIREFFVERELAPNPRITFNLALCFDALHRDEDAYLLFSEYLAGGDEDAERRTLATEALARLTPRVSLVAVTSDPPGASVFLDRREHGAYGVTPLVVPVSEGEHTLRLEREGFAPTELTVRAVRGARVEVTGSLRRIVGHLVLEAPSGARVEVRDAAGATVASGEAPLRVELAPADYEIEVRADGYEAWRRLTRLGADATETLTAALVRRPEPTGELTVTASAAGATIEVDGEVSGFTPAVLDGLALGAHRLRVSHPGLRPWEGEVALAADARRWLTVSLARPTETTRSELTWVAGGAAVASLVVSATLGGLALDAYGRFQSLEAQGRAYAMGTGPAPLGSLEEVRAQGVTLATGADVALGAAATLAVVTVVLFVATESTSTQSSSAVVADGERSVEVGEDAGDHAETRSDAQ